MKITLLTGKTFEIQQAVGDPARIKVVRPPRARRLSIRIDSKARRAVLSVPPLCSKKQAIEFAKSYEGWIENQLEKIPQTERFAHGSQFSLFGEPVTIANDSPAGCFIENGTLHISGKPEFVHRRTRDFIKSETKKRLSELSRAKAAQLDGGAKLKSVAIKDTKSRWGSCSTRGNINYSWRIALAPDYVVDYLVSHEVAHLRHPDHSPAFWQCVESLCPDNAKLGNAWLKKHGKTLHAFAD